MGLILYLVLIIRAFPPSPLNDVITAGQTSAPACLSTYDCERGK